MAAVRMKATVTWKAKDFVLFSCGLPPLTGSSPMRAPSYSLGASKR